MARPTTKDELLEAGDSGFARLMALVDGLDPGAVEEAGACEEWSVKDLMAHLAAWHEMLLGWERVGRTGEKPVMPAPGFGWGDTPALNDGIWQRTRDDSLDDVRSRFERTRQEVRDLIDTYSDSELFAKKRYSWTGTTSIGSYAVSATSSHYAWAEKLIRTYAKTLG